MKKAYNLSEVLTTMMVIGIIAAMTIPALYNVSIAEKNRTNLKKTFASYTINIQQILASTGTICETLACTRHWSCRNPQEDEDGNRVCDTKHNGALAQFKNFNYENCDDCVKKDSNLPAIMQNKEFSTYRLPNMAYASIYDYEGNCTTVIPENSANNNNDTDTFRACSVMVLDVNGHKGPNTPCKDRYAFYVANQPYSRSETVNGKDYNLVQTYLVPFGYNDVPNFESEDGYNCTAKVMYNNWKISKQ